MPVSKALIVDGNIMVGDFRLPVAEVEALEVSNTEEAATTKSVKVFESRVGAILESKQRGAHANYTIALVITREPLTDQEKASVSAKERASKDRKAAKDQEVADRIKFEKSSAQEFAVRMAKELVPPAPVVKPLTIADQITEAMNTVKAISALMPSQK